MASALLPLVSAVVLGAGCKDKEDARSAPAAPAVRPSIEVRFIDATDAAGLEFRHRHCGTGEKYMPETMGSGGAFLDYDGDRQLDVYLINNAATPGYQGPSPENGLFRNDGDGTFSNVTAEAGVAGGGYGMGVTVGDFDNDGWSDLYVTNFGANVLYRNNGDGTFSDVTERAGVGDPAWSTSAAFGDLDHDGDLDLYVANYVDFTYDNHKYCGERRLGIQAYCHPDVYNGVRDSLYLNRGDGTFEETGRERLAKADSEWMLEGKGLGVVMGDYDGDGWVDLYVANDSTPNFLWHNLGDGRFEDAAPYAGVGFNADGKTEAGMGAAIGDADNDGRPDLFVTNLDLETNTFYRNEGQGYFSERTFESGLGAPSWLLVGFGTGFLDFDHDGWLDLVIANGHIIDNIDRLDDKGSYAQPNLVFHNQGGGSFRDVTAELGEEMSRPRVSRGMATADYDGDGDLDLLLTHNNDRALLLRNDGGDRGHWLQVRLIGVASNRDGFGARLTLEAGGLRLVREHRSASSYLSQDGPWVHFGLGRAQVAERLEVVWPSGRRELWRQVAANRVVELREGDGDPAPSGPP